MHHFVSPHTGVFVFSFTVFNYGQSTAGATTNPHNVIQVTYMYGYGGTAVAVLYAVTNDIIGCELLEAGLWTPEGVHVFPYRVSLWVYWFHFIGFQLLRLLLPSTYINIHIYPFTYLLGSKLCLIIRGTSMHI